MTAPAKRVLLHEEKDVVDVDLTAFSLEGQPTPRQISRLVDFLRDLAYLSRQHGIVLNTSDDYGAVLVDAFTETIIAVDPMFHTTPEGRIDSYISRLDIRDGDWVVDTAQGPVRQRDAGES